MVLSYLPLKQIQIMEEWINTNGYITIFTPELLRSILIHYNIDPMVIQDVFVRPVAELEKSIIANTYDPIIFQLSPFELFVQLAFWSGRIGFRCHFYAKPLYCLISAVRHNDIQLVNYYLNQLESPLDFRLRVAHVQFLLKLATEYADPIIVFTLMAEQIVNKFDLSKKMAEYIRSNYNNYFEMKSIAGFNQIIRSEVKPNTDEPTFLYSFDSQLIAMENPNLLFGANFPSFRDGSSIVSCLEPYLAKSQLQEIRNIMEFVTQKWQKSAPKEVEDFSNYCKILLGYDLDISQLTTQVAGKTKFHAYMVAAMIIVMSPLYNKYREEIGESEVTHNRPITYPSSEVLYDLSLAKGIPFSASITDSFTPEAKYILQISPVETLHTAGEGDAVLDPGSHQISPVGIVYPIKPRPGELPNCDFEYQPDTCSMYTHGTRYSFTIA